MKNFETSPEKFNPHEVIISSELSGLNLKKISQLAYVVNPESFSIIISKYGHAKIIRSHGKDKHDLGDG